MDTQKLAIIALITSTAAIARPAAADHLSTNTGARIVEVQHDVDLRLDHGAALFRVQRAFENQSAREDLLVLQIDLPEGAAAIDLKVHDGSQWRPAELMEARRAENLYREVRGLPPHDPRPPALMTWQTSDTLQLELHPVPPGQRRLVQYTLVAPTRYEGGRFEVQYPHPGDRLLSPTLRVLAPQPQTLHINGQPWASNAPFTASSGDPALVALTQPIDTLQARLGRVNVAPGKHLLRLEVEAAPSLGAIPADLNLVFLLDTSLSLGSDGVEQQLSLIRALLSRAPHARFEVIAFNRRARRLAGHLAAAADLNALIDRARAAGLLQPGNGSALDEALKLAAIALDRQPGEHLIVAMTDALMRPDFDPHRAHAAIAQVAAPPTLHIAIPRAGGDPTLHRRDHLPLSPLASRTGGVLFDVAGVDGDPALLAAAAEEFLRPLRIDHLDIDGEPTGLGLDPTLPEGQGARLTAFSDHGPSTLTLTGQLWSRPFRQNLQITETSSRYSAAFLFSEEEHGDLTDAQARAIALRARVLSPFTAFVALSTGKRPAPEFGFGTLSAHGIGRSSTHVTTCGFGFARAPITFDAAHALQAARDACVSQHNPAPGWQARFSLHTTEIEIVDVLATDLPEGPFGQCLLDAAWAIQLPDIFAQHPRETLAAHLR